MIIELSHKDQKTIWRLGKCLKAGMVPVDEVRTMIEGLQRKIEVSSAGQSPSVRINRKDDRKSMYRRKLKVA